MEKPIKIFSYQVAENLIKIFSKYRVKYLFIGKSGAILYGFPDTTQDVDIFPKKSPENGKRIVKALRELGFQIDEMLASSIIRGKDFIQIRGGPFDIDLIFAPDGIESFEQAKKHSVLIEKKYPAASLSDIINSKKTAFRQKDRESLERLESFEKYLKNRGR